MLDLAYCINAGSWGTASRGIVSVMGLAFLKVPGELRFTPTNFKEMHMVSRFSI